MAASPPPPAPETSTEGGNYDASFMIYPMDLYGDSDAANYVQFFINVQEDAKIAKNQSLVAGPAPNKQYMNTNVGKPIDKTAVATKQLEVDTIVGGATGAAAGGVGGAGSAASKYGGASGGKVLKGTLGGAMSGLMKGVGAGLVKAGTTAVGLGLLDSAGVDFGKTTKRLKSAITLYTPNQLSVRYGAGWGEEEVDIATALAAADTPGSMTAESKPLRSAAAATVLSKNAGYSAMSRVAANPRKEQVFKGVDFRRFTFEYQFAPRDEAEAENAMNIIYLFKYHMHPEFKNGSANFIYVYPSEFDIEYYIGGSENPYLHKHSSCVLTEMNINYSPNGIFNTFPNGMPTIINMTLNFVELEMLTKERIVRGL